MLSCWFFLLQGSGRGPAPLPDTPSCLGPSLAFSVCCSGSHCSFQVFPGRPRTLGTARHSAAASPYLSVPAASFAV